MIRKKKKKKKKREKEKIKAILLDFEHLGYLDYLTQR